MEAFFVSTALVAVAEIGDKTQLLALMLAARYRKPWPIVLGILCATLANHALAAWVGAAVAAWVGADAMRWIHENADEARALGARARISAQETLSLQAAGKRFARRLDEIKMGKTVGSRN